MTTRIEMAAIPVRPRTETAWIQRLMIFLTLVVAADSLFGERGLATRSRQQREFGRVQHELAAIRQENAGLRTQVRRLRSEPDAIETLAREELGLIRPGELLILIAR